MWRRFDELPLAPAAAATEATEGSAADVPSPDFDPADLATLRPGHAVLARIAELHASAPSTKGIRVMPDEIVSWAVGYVGEEKVGAELECLGPEWHVLHAVPVGAHGSDIDHVVIGPPGVFSVNTQHHRGVGVDVRRDSVFVAGQHQDYLDSLRLEVERVAAVARTVVPTAPVRGVLCTVDAKLRVNESPTEAVAVRHDQIVGWLQAAPARLSAEEVGQLHGLLRRTESWDTTPPPAPAPRWVAELARSLAAEHRVVADQRRADAAEPADAPARRGPRRARTLTRAGRRTPVTARVAATLSGAPGRWVLALVALIVLATVGASLVRAITARADPGLPQPTVSATRPAAAAPAAAVVGQPCPKRAVAAKDAAGHAVICLPRTKATGAALVWTRRA
jgi:hypothetical protein